VHADLVMGVPDSGVPAAEGYARRSGIPYGQGLIKNRYIGRTFIEPDQLTRANGVRRKLNPLRDNVAGKRLIVVDDSIVRGTTTGHRRHAARRGAAEVHLRISSPPSAGLLLRHRHPNRDDLLAATSLEAIASSSTWIDRLHLPQNLKRAIDAPGAASATPA